MKFALIYSFMALLLGPSVAPYKIKFSLNFTAHDEDGAPAKGVVITLVYLDHSEPGPDWGKVIYANVNGATDNDGVVSLHAKTRLPEISYGINTSSNYYGIGGLMIFPREIGGWGHGGGHVSTTNISLVLRRVINPVPFIGKKVDTHIPESGRKYGYDFVLGDWVAPLGAGRVADAEFELSGFWKSWTNYDSTLKLSFPNSGDGAQTFLLDGPETNSAFKSPRQAPTDGYKPVLLFHLIRLPEQKEYEWQDDNSTPHNYFLRIRTVLDEKGNVQSALYGKIYRGLEFGGVGPRGGYLKIRSYYINPEPNSRNMEFDPRRNLFKDLPSLDQVRDP